MTTFDQILPIISIVLSGHVDRLSIIGNLVINRDLNGRIRLIVNKSVQSNPDAMAMLNIIALALHEQLGPHGYPVNNALLFETSDVAFLDTPFYLLEGFESVKVIDRLANDSNWASIAPVSAGAPRIVFFSIKGGVGRSTALAASALALAQEGKRVLVLDLDLESPGLSSALLPAERRPKYGIADWLVEDLVGNGPSVFDDMVATSTLAHDGEIYVVPAHGRDPGEYISKLGRVWMPRIREDGARETWSQRLSRLIGALESRWQPGVILIDSRAGIDEIASSCVTDMGATMVLLFAIDGEQTWSGYRILFQHWRKCGVAQLIRERLQIVGAMIPETDTVEYFDGLRERGYDLFAEELYDEIPPGELVGSWWNFGESDEIAPHFPLAVRWHRGFAALRSLHSRFDSIDDLEVNNVFGPVIEGLLQAIGKTGEGDD